jgi:hypothetical protein
MYPSPKSWLKGLHLCPDMEHIELQDFHLDDQEVEDKIGAMKNLKELRVRSITVPSDVTSNVAFLTTLHLLRNFKPTYNLKIDFQ